MSQQQHSQQQQQQPPPPPPQQPSQASSHALVTSQPMPLAPLTNVDNLSNDYSQPPKAVTIDQQNSTAHNPDQILIPTNPNHSLQLNPRSPFSPVPVGSPSYHYQQNLCQSETSSTIIDLDSHRFTPLASRSNSRQSVTSAAAAAPSHYYQPQHYYPTSSTYANYVTCYNPNTPISHQYHPNLHHHHHHHQQQRPQYRQYIDPQFNTYYSTNRHQTSYNIHSANNQTGQVLFPTRPYYHSTTLPPQTQPRTMGTQVAPAGTTTPGPKLIWLLFMHRHGDRTPLNMAPRDKYNNISYWPEGFGNLNNAGRMRMYKLGKFIRRRYDSFLTDNVREVYSRSSDVDRCIESSHALLAGLYPPRSGFVWNKDLLWVPAPVHTVPGPDDYFLGSLKVSYAPHGSSDFINEIHLIQNSEAVKKLYEESKYERELLERELGYEFDMFHRFKCTYSTLDIEERNGLEMPAWYTPTLKQKLYRFAGLAFSLAGGGTEKLKKIRCGHLLEDLVTRMEMASIEGPKIKEQSDFQQLTDAPTVIDDRKIIHYSTHDSNMAAFLEALNVNFPTPVPPGFGATFFVELYVDLNDQGLPVSEKYIKFFYMDDTDTEKPIEKVIPNAKLNDKGQLTLNNFRNNVKHLFPGI